MILERVIILDIEMTFRDSDDLVHSNDFRDSNDFERL